MADNYDLVVLGAGPGGYVAAIRAAQLGMKTAVVEKERVGGVCLHQGCIPSKSLLRSAELYHEMRQSEDYGIRVGEVQLEMDLVQGRKNRVKDQLHKGIQQLLHKNGVTVIERDRANSGSLHLFAHAGNHLCGEGRRKRSSRCWFPSM